MTAAPDNPLIFLYESWLPFPIEQTFAFFADPRNLPPLMPSWQQARIDEMSLTPARVPFDAQTLKTPAAGEGSLITISLRPVPLLPLRIRWVARINEVRWIDEVQRSASFTDVQLSGPFAYWRHRHALRAESRNGEEVTLLHDEVHYLPPMGVVGRVLGRPFFEMQLRSVFRYREQQARRLIGRAAGVCL